MVATAAAPKHPCDELAAHPEDPQKVGPGMPDSALKPLAAIVSCRQAVSQYPDEVRFKAQLARGYIVQGRIREGMAPLNEAINQGMSPTALFLAGEVFSGARASSEKVDPVKAFEYYKAAAELGFRPAADKAQRLETDLAAQGVKVPATPSTPAPTAAATPATGSPSPDGARGAAAPEPAGTGSPVPARRAASPIEACDKLGAHPQDPEAFARGVQDEALQGPEVVEACQRAVQLDRSSPRLQFQLARGLLKQGRVEDAVDALLEAARQGHGGALAYLGDIYLDGGPGIESDPVTARKLFERAAASGFEPAKAVLAEFEDYTDRVAQAEAEERQSPVQPQAATPGGGGRTDGRYNSPEIIENILRGDYDAVSLNEFYTKVYLVSMAETIGETCGAHFTKREILQLRSDATTSSFEMSAAAGAQAMFGRFMDLAKAAQNPGAYVQRETKAGIDQQMLPEESMQDAFTLMRRHACNSQGLKSFSQHLVAFIRNEGAPRVSADAMLRTCRGSYPPGKETDNFCMCFLGAAAEAPMSRKDRRELGIDFKAAANRIMGKQRQRFNLCQR